MESTHSTLWFEMNALAAMWKTDQSRARMETERPVVRLKDAGGLGRGARSREGDK